MGAGLGSKKMALSATWLWKSETAAVDKHVGKPVRMRRLLVKMSRVKLAHKPSGY
jgi:hypothetical protein